jgi:hypothetical protein
MQKKESSNMPEVNRDEWNVEKLQEEGSNEQSDEMLRKTLRGDEEKGNPDDRDIVGSANRNETPQGREEAKNDTRSKANNNG